VYGSAIEWRHHWPRGGPEGRGPFQQVPERLRMQSSSSPSAAASSLWGYSSGTRAEELNGARRRFMSVLGGHRRRQGTRGRAAAPSRTADRADQGRAPFARRRIRMRVSPVAHPALTQSGGHGPGPLGAVPRLAGALGVSRRQPLVSLPHPAVRSRRPNQVLQRTRPLSLGRPAVRSASTVSPASSERPGR
jgi:hypothetical protein